MLSEQPICLSKSTPHCIIERFELLREVEWLEALHIGIAGDNAWSRLALGTTHSGMA